MIRLRRKGDEDEFTLVEQAAFNDLPARRVAGG
jgi:hypothetical protein